MYVQMVTMTVRPEDVGVFRARRDAAMAAIREHHPDVSAATLVRLDESRWVDWVEWASLEKAQAAAESAPGIEAVAAWFGLFEAVESMQHGQVAHVYGSEKGASASRAG